MSEKKEQKEIKVEIQLDEEIAQGIYSNLVVANHNDSEFVLDFIFVQPQVPRAKVRSRVVTSPKHVKRMVLALQENLRRYEEAFGEVELGPAGPNQPEGKYH